MEEFSGNAFSYWLLAFGTWLLTNSQQLTATNTTAKDQQRFH